MRTPIAALVATAAVGAVPLGTPSATAATTPPLPAVAYASDRDGDSEIYVRHTDGRTALLTRNAASDHDPVWSPDGRRIAFVSDRDGDSEIYVMAADGSGVRQLTRNSRTADGAPAGDHAPAWSPDGRRIAFASTRDGGEPEIYVMGADGSGVRRLTRTAAYVMDHTPAWSPDGRWIAFASNRVSYDNVEVYRMRADGTGVQRVTRTASGVDDNAPVWSPNGRMLAFSSTRGGTQGLWASYADGTGVRRISDDPQLDDVFPRWTADGKRLVFWTFGREHATGPRTSADVWVVGSDGRGRTRLLGTAAEETSPDPRRARG